MNYYGPRELAASFRTVRKNTIQIAEEIPEDHYNYRAAPGSRSVAETLVHIAVAPRVQEHIHVISKLHTLAGFDFFGLHQKLLAEEQVSRSKAEIVELLRSEGERFARILETFPEEHLQERVEYPQGMTPPSKSRFEMLLGPKEHEMHHRGQLMLIERMLGVIPHLTRQMQERVAAMQAGRS
ncbi:MAG: DinB family protein [Bryobacteraceae bacterium]